MSGSVRPMRSADSARVETDERRRWCEDGRDRAPDEGREPADMSDVVDVDAERERTELEEDEKERDVRELLRE